MARLQASLYVFVLSLVGIAVTMIHTLDVAMSGIDFSYTEIFIMAILPLLVAILLAVYSWKVLKPHGARQV